MGGAWVSKFGWLILDLVGWRNFVLLTSIPLFLPPIFMLHCCVKAVNNLESPTDRSENSAQSSAPECSRASSSESTRTNPSEPRQTNPSESGEITDRESNYLLDKRDTTVPNFATRVFKAASFIACNICIGYGSIILLPSVIRSFKEHHHGEIVNEQTDATSATDTSCQSAVQGSDLLIVAAVTGGTNVIGRPLGYMFMKLVPFRILHSVVAFTIALSYGIMITTPGLAVSAVLMGLAKLGYSIQGAEVFVLLFDSKYFGSKGPTLGAGITTTSDTVEAFLGTCLAAFLASHVAK